MNLASLIERHPAEANAFFDGGRWHTWGEVRSRCRALSRRLGELSVGPGDRVAFALPTSGDFVVTYLGTLFAGAVAIPLNPSSPPSELVSELQSVEPHLVIVDASAVSSLEQSGFAVRAVDDLASRVDESSTDDEALGIHPRSEDDIAVLLFTSGTAGSPKAAMLSHGNLLSNLVQMQSIAADLFRPDDVGMAAIPLFHIFGLNVALGLAIATGASVVLQTRYDPKESLRMARDLDVTVLLGVPAMFAAWADEPDADKGLRSVRIAMSGAASLPAHVAKKFEQRFGLPLWQGYGLTEASPAVATSLGTGNHDSGSAGAVLPGVEVRIVDESGADVLRGDPGEIWVKGLNVFKGYWNDPEATAAVLTHDGWLRTGDVGVMSDNGDLHVVDRIKDLVIVSGFNVFPAEVEHVVAQLDEVAEAAVVGRPDAGTGESVEVFVVLRPGSSLSDDDVRRHCTAHLARYKCPRAVHFVEELPHGLVGKALRRALREQMA